MKNKGYFTSEGIVVLGIFILVLNGYLGLISINFKVDTLIKNYSKSQHNYEKNLDYLGEEIKKAVDIRYINEKLIFSLGSEEENLQVKYWFRERTMFREVKEEDGNIKFDTFLKDIGGNFILEDNLLRLRVQYKGEDEEYIYYVK